MAGHWYRRNGESCHTVVGKNGRERDTTLRDARTLGLVPSVTTVLDVIAKPALTSWCIDQALDAALTLPRLDGETLQAFKARALEDSKRQTRAASEEGDRIHAAVECHFKGQAFPLQYSPHVLAVVAELEATFPHVTDWVAERSFAHPLGFGGRCDLHSPSTGITADLKSKDFARGDGKRLVYDQHFQLAPYNRGLGLKPAPCAAIFVSRNNPGHVDSHIWDVAEVQEGWEVFASALALWKRLQKYDPAFGAATLEAA